MDTPPLGARHLLGADPPWQQTPPWEQTPLEVTWDQTGSDIIPLERTWYRIGSVNRQMLLKTLPSLAVDKNCFVLKQAKGIWLDSFSQPEQLKTSRKAFFVVS